MIEHNYKTSTNGLAYAKGNDKRRELSRETKMSYKTEIIKDTERNLYSEMKRLAQEERSGDQQQTTLRIDN